MRTFFASMTALLAAAALAGCGGAQDQINIQPGPMPPNGSWDGVFQSPAYGRMEFTLEGNRVLGLYEGERHYGRIEGELNGNVLYFNWTQWKTDVQGKSTSKNGRGYFQYTVDIEKASTRTREVHRIKGSWGYGESMSDGGPWDAIRLERAKKMLKPHGDDEGIEEDDMGTSAGFDVGGEDTSVNMSEPKAKEKPKKEEPEDSLDSLF